MEWVVLGLGVLAVLGWRLVRPASVPPAPHVRPRPVASTTAAGAAGTALRATDPDDPDGAFMDGYVVGRYTERWEHGAGREDRGRPVAGRGGPDVPLTDGEDEDGHDDTWDDPWRTGHGAGGAEVWEDPDAGFHDDSSDDW